MQKFYQIEKMTHNEQAFMQKKYNKEIMVYKKMMNLLMGFFIPVVSILTYTTYKYNLEDKVKEHSPSEHWQLFIVTAIVLAIYAILSFLIFYNGYYLDAKKGQKIIENCEVINKKYYELTGQYFLFIDSIIKDKIEMSQQEFDYFNVGDEINIEYGRYSKEFFSYF